MGENIPGTRPSLNLQSICIRATDQIINRKLTQKPSSWASLSPQTGFENRTHQQLSGKALAAGNFFSAEPTYRWIVPFRSIKGGHGCNPCRAQRAGGHSSPEQFITVLPTLSSQRGASTDHLMITLRPPVASGNIGLHPIPPLVRFLSFEMPLVPAIPPEPFRAFRVFRGRKNPTGANPQITPANSPPDTSATSPHRSPPPTPVSSAPLLFPL